MKEWRLTTKVKTTAVKEDRTTRLAGVLETILKKEDKDNVADVHINE